MYRQSDHSNATLGQAGSVIQQWSSDTCLVQYNTRNVACLQEQAIEQVSRQQYVSIAS